MAAQPTIDSAALNIQQAEFLAPFFNYLKTTESGKKQKIHITHIGDSHIQADFVSAKSRELWFAKYGSGGRGLLFPFRAAKTNGPFDYKDRSSTYFEAKRNVFPQRPMEIGVSGITIGTSGAFAQEILLHNKSEENAIASFQVFYNKSMCAPKVVATTDTNYVLEAFLAEEYYTVQSGDYLGKIAAKYKCSVKQIMAWNNLSNTRIDVGDKLIIKKSEQLQLPEALPLEEPKWTGNAWVLPKNKEFYHLLITSNQECAGRTELHGIYVENGLETGVVFNTIGVNGAHFKHYNLSSLFLEEMKQIPTELFIVSLGTNESLDPNMNQSVIENEAITFISNLKKIHPEASILLTTNPYAFQKKQANSKCTLVQESLVKVAKQMQVAYWDFYSVMGGEESTKQWNSVGYAQRDLIHLTQKGYELQGELLFNAIQEAYGEFLKTTQ